MLGDDQVEEVGRSHHHHLNPMPAALQMFQITDLTGKIVIGKTTATCLVIKTH